MENTLNEVIERIPHPLAHLDAALNDFTSQLTIMDCHDRVRHTKFCAEIVACYKPANALETQLAYSIAADYWRLNRARGLEEGLFSLDHPDPDQNYTGIPLDRRIAQTQTFTFISRQGDFKFLSQYEMRIQRSITLNKAELKKLQADHPKPSPIPEPHPNNDGFAFSNQPPAPEPASADPAVTEPAKIRTATANGFAFSNPATTPKVPAQPPNVPAAAPDSFAFSPIAPTETNGTLNGDQRILTP